jgi:hypothetical protein
MRWMVACAVVLAGSCGAPALVAHGEIQGEACDPRGRPLVGVPVIVDGLHTRTDADGHFRAKGIEPGVSSVDVTGIRNVDVVVPARDIAVVFDDRCRATGNDAPPFIAFGA